MKLAGSFPPLPSFCGGVPKMAVSLASLLARDMGTANIVGPSLYHTARCKPSLLILRLHALTGIVKENAWVAALPFCNYLYFFHLGRIETLPISFWFLTCDNVLKWLENFGTLVLLMKLSTQILWNSHGWALKRLASSFYYGSLKKLLSLSETVIIYRTSCNAFRFNLDCRMEHRTYSTRKHFIVDTCFKFVFLLL